MKFPVFFISLRLLPYIVPYDISREREMMDWHNLHPQEAVRRLHSDSSCGLSSSAARTRLEQYGKNTLSAQRKQSILLKFLSQFSDFMVLILLAAAAVSFSVALVSGDGDFIDPIMILAIVILNAMIGTVQECRAEKAIEALKKLSAPHARVLRDGKVISVPSEEVTAGDILIFEAGDLVCADARLLEAVSVRAEESSLTGEAVPAEKRAESILPAETPPADRENMLFASTCITSGHGKAVVVETGMNTQVGKIAGMLDNGESPRTPLQKSLAKTGKVLGICALLICGVIFVLGLIQQIPPLEMFMISISLAVAAIPEGLPAIVTIVLAMGVRKLAAHRAVVRKLPAVETLGSASVICSDKTGTLTQNKMTVQTLSGITGTIPSHSTDGKFLLTLSALCNNSTLKKSGTTLCGTGDPTEAALVTAAASAGLMKDALEQKFPRVSEVPFDSVKKRMATVHRLPTGGFRTIFKGAPDILLSLCTSYSKAGTISPMSQTGRNKLLTENGRLAAQAMRVIACAYKDTDTMPSAAEMEKELVFSGFIGMTDPPRPQAYGAVAQCRRAGIKPVMITGDHIATAKAIAEKLGIYRKGDKAASGPELDHLSQQELEKNIFDYSVFARVSPEHKMRIVKAFQHTGAVVAMTGDGVNDAPALKCADIGCAMGRSGTEVAKSAADMVLTDDNFATIVNAVEQGRGIFDNIRKTIHFLLSSNIGEILTVLCAFLMRLPSPLLAIQLLWVNLVTDSLPALALGAEPARHDIMEKPPENSGKGIFSKSSVRSIVIEGCFIGALAFLAYTIGRVFFDVGSDPVIGRTMTFAVLSLSQLVHAFNLRSEHSLFRTGILGNPKLIGAFLIGAVMQIAVISVPALAAVFKTVPLAAEQWLIVSGLSLVPLAVVETEKLLSRK